MSEQVKNLQLVVDYVDDDSSNNLNYSVGENSLSFARMQALTPSLSVGGLFRLFDVLLSLE